MCRVTRIYGAEEYSGECDLCSETGSDSCSKEQEDSHEAKRVCLACNFV